jgi:hypothetical protein
MINFAQLPEWMDHKIWMDKIMLSGLEGTYTMVVDKEGYITDTRLLTDYNGNNLPKGTLWLPTSIFRSQFRELWGDFSMDAYVNNKLPDEVGPATRSELANLIKLANDFGKLQIQWNPHQNPSVHVGKRLEHPYLYHYKWDGGEDIKRLTDNLTVSIYHIYDEKDDKVEIIFNVTDPFHYLNRPKWNPKAQMPLSVLFG